MGAGTREARRRGQHPDTVSRALSTVKKTLREYADRGIFRGLTERHLGRDAVEFDFLWLTERQVRLVFDPKSTTLRVRDLLPDVSVRSQLYAELRELVKSRQDGALPKHRMVDSNRAVAKLANRKGSVSLVLTVHNNQYRYGVRKILNLVNEIFVFLHGSHVEYMWEHFDVPQE